MMVGNSAGWALYLATIPEKRLIHQLRKDLCLHTSRLQKFSGKYNDIAFLADLTGHESIETTRIYLRRTAGEQQALVDKIVTL